MSPLFDQTGRQAESQSVEFTSGVEIRSAVAKHDEILLIDGEGRLALRIDHPSYPGAGLSLEIADHVRTADER